ncbi:hypothetical protein [Roseospira goensis]|uniref:Lipoprotein n=1 Tax=Roseospira goensis TaxID=391922 RepID=A0A7W6S326_9PROT|nr:hypothetical protein [Roseospira goensis]MBB4287944.1 hypothetical protein [Roseospira goensis]
MPVHRLAPVALPVVLPLALGGCLPAAIPGAVLGVATVYCAGVSETGKTMARDALTSGRPLIACPPAADPDRAPYADPGPPGRR